MKLKSLLLLFLFLCSYFLNAQNTFDIVFPQDRDQVCKACLDIFRQRTSEVQFSIKRNGNKLYFQVNDKAWFDLLFKNQGDGIAVDVVSKDIYDCKYESVKETQIKGTLLKPVYSQKLKTDIKISEANTYQVYVGDVPSALRNDELEYNILFLSNKNMCSYYLVYDLESYPWSLLDMGVYLDEITYSERKIGDDSYFSNNKTLKFKVPFKKNKSEYSQKDIKPIYDSLRLTDFNIKAINIKAYSSVEGILKRNIELQQSRAKSIIKALQTFQKSTIKTEISSSENWVEFLNDIKGTAHENLSKLSKNDIRAKLVGATAEQLEPILKNHRKAILELELEKKDSYQNVLAEPLLVKFNEAISSENIDEALKIQNSIFMKIKHQEVSPDFLSKMKIPKQTKFVKIACKNSAFKYLINVRQGVIVYNELLELEKLAPRSKEVKYNIAAIKVQAWQFKWMDIDEARLKQQIYGLANYGIDKSLISRMMVNYNLITAERLMRNRDYSNKDKSVLFIKDNYKKFSLSDYDYLSLAQFLSYYGNTKMSVELLEDKAKSIDIDENLLFYYLNLTLVDGNLTSDVNYRAIMLNAININKNRYCKLFNSIEKGGVTFQLLKDEYLRETYCENCNN